MTICENLTQEQKRLEEIIVQTISSLLQDFNVNIILQSSKYRLDAMAENIWDLYIGDMMENELKDLVKKNNLTSTYNLYEIYDGLRNKFYQVFYEKIKAN